jgi:hypothetical protein
MFLFRRWARMLLDDRYLSFARDATTTVIPLAAIRDVSIGHYPRVMQPLGMNFISVTYEEGGQSKRLFFSPSPEGWFVPRSHFNRFVAERFNELRTAIATATGRAPGNTPANQLGTPSSSLAVLLLFLLLLLPPMVACGTFLNGWPRKDPMPALRPSEPLIAPFVPEPAKIVPPPPQIRGKPPDSGINE